MRSPAALLLAFSLPLWAGCGTPEEERDPDADAESRGTATTALDDLAARYWEWTLETNPIQATYLGIREYDDRLPDISEAGRQARLREAEAFLRELERIDLSTLDGQDRLTHLALGEELGNRLRREACALWEWDVNHRGGPQVSFLNLVQVQRAASPEDGRRMVRRWKAMGPYIDDHIANLRGGLQTGRVPSRVIVRHVMEQLDGLLAKPDSAWPLLEPAKADRPEWSEEEREAFARELAGAVAEIVRPAFRRYRDALGEEVEPQARSGNAVGVHAIPGGEACYAAVIRAFTSLQLSPREIHEFGLQENARIRAEMVELGERLLGTSDVTRIQRRLRSDPALHFSSPEEVSRTAEEATERARRAIPTWFGRLPKADIVVEEIPEYEAPYTTIAYYRQPAPDGSRPGTYFVNTYRPETRPRYEAEVLAFHEGIPGHHLQIAIAQELEGLPEFRKHQGVTAFVEGWALYTERLSDEMGLYSGDLDRMGVLSFDAWRASRLVVDTGIHAFGWTRRQAIEYMLENTLLAENNIENEVDRYISWPGQALAYKLGQREILDLRREAREQLGDAFDIAEFHDRVLENGAVSLAVLRSVVTRWIEEREGASGHE